MIIIFEQSDLTNAGRARCYGVAPVDPTLSDLEPDLLPAASTAETVYVTRRDQSHIMIKARNAPLDQRRVHITVTRKI